jgi:hypothetical protein
MCSGDPVERLRADLDELVAADVVARPDATLRSDLLALLAARNQLDAAISSWLASFDSRGLYDEDACKTAAVWVRAYGRGSGRAAAALVRRARLLRDLPAVAEAAGRGAVSSEHVERIRDLVNDVGIDAVRPADQILADAAAATGLDEVTVVCGRIRDYVDPDGPEPEEAFERRELTLSNLRGMVMVRGRLDPEGGAAACEAIDALMRPPGPDDPRTPAQRRADALVDLARGALAHSELPTVGGTRPQVGVLIPPQLLLYGPDGADPRTRMQAPYDTGTDAPDIIHHFDGDGEAATPASASDALAALGVPPPAEPAWLNWFGPIPAATAKRILCDCDIWRIVLDPTTGLPLDVGRAHRLVPYWIRRALYTRDRGCRWPGCPTPAPWTDAHHLRHWHAGGVTRAEDLLLTCRYHHVLLHEGRWSIHLDPATGQVHVTRPDGTPHDLGPTRPWTTPTTQAHDPPESRADDPPDTS